MRQLNPLVLAFLLTTLGACPRAQSTPDVAAAPPAEADAPPAEADQPPTIPELVLPEPTDSALVTIINMPIGRYEMATQTIVYANGTWRKEEKVGQLHADELQKLMEDVENADFHPDLQPRMSCLAISTMEWSISFGGETAAWQSPCGGSAPPDVDNVFRWVLEKVK
ncbi:MAG: hypothetical protein HN348_09010 [Proteobacteria bacterium]|nr:hypothetical protein [Pseudomonadota bacterium]